MLKIIFKLFEPSLH